LDGRLRGANSPGNETGIGTGTLGEFYFFKGQMGSRLDRQDEAIEDLLLKKKQPGRPGESFVLQFRERKREKFRREGWK